MFDFDKNKNRNSTLFEKDITKLKSSKKKPKKVKSKTKSKQNNQQKKSFYDDVDDEDVSSSDFYSNEFSDTENEFVNNLHVGVFNFKWWEYLIFLVELVLLTYAFLVFFNVIPIF